MSDIELRFYKDMLVLSSPVLPALERLGVNVERDAELTLLLEPETIEAIHKQEQAAGAQCVVAQTASLTPARLARVRMEERASDLAKAAFEAARATAPQHILAEIAPCGLPLDPSSKGSLNESFDQYRRAGKVLGELPFDAYFLNGFKSSVDLKCALMGLRAVSSLPVFVSVNMGGEGSSVDATRGFIEDAAEVAEEYEASVMGFEVSAGVEATAGLARRLAQATSLPLLAQIEVRRERRGIGAANGSLARGGTAREGSECGLPPSSMMQMAEALRSEGIQFLRATGDATPAYTGALAASTLGLDAVLPQVETRSGEAVSWLGSASPSASLPGSEDVSDRAMSLAARVSSCIAGSNGEESL